MGVCGGHVTRVDAVMPADEELPRANTAVAVRCACGGREEERG